MRYGMMLPVILIAAVLLAGAADRIAISITKNSDLRCGSIRRGQSVTIGYEDSRAGEYIVSGEMGAPFRLSLGVSTIAPGEESIELILSGDNSAYSIDNGVTWTTFPGGLLWCDLRFPDFPGSGSRTAVRVRVGGTFVADGIQPKGEYRRRVLIQAEYRRS